jgi:hypothetical protein
MITLFPIFAMSLSKECRDASARAVDVSDTTPGDDGELVG